MKFVYVIESNGLYKIGYSTNPVTRVAAAKIFAPACKLIAVYNGTKADEKALHKLFNHCRRSGEWFGLSAGDLSKIEDFFSGKESLSAYKLLVIAFANHAVSDQKANIRPYKKIKIRRAGISESLTIHDRRLLANCRPPILNEALALMAKNVYANGGNTADLANKCGISKSYAEKIYAAFNKAAVAAEYSAF